MNKRFTTAEIAKLTDSILEGNPSLEILNVADLESAGPNDISFLANPRYESAMKKSQAGAVFVFDQFPSGNDRVLLKCKDPSRAFQTLAELFNPNSDKITGFTGIHSSAVIHPSAKIGQNVSIGPFVVIDEGSEIADNTRILSHVTIGPFCTIGTNTTIHANVTIRERCKIGSNVIIQPGAVIGSCGFGYIQDKEGKHIKLNQIGIVVIEDDVEIGANTTIDRSRFKETRIGKGTKIDNLVQIGHGVEVGPQNLIIAQTGIAGSTSTGKQVILAGQVAVAGHLHLDDNVIVAGKSGVSKSLKAGTYNGIPCIPLADYNKTAVYIRKIPELFDRVKKLEKEST